MKKVLPPGVSPAKRKRTGSNTYGSPEAVDLSVDGNTELVRWRQAPTPPSLGMANKDWELPDIGVVNINIAKDWETAEKEAAKERKKEEEKRRKREDFLSQQQRSKRKPKASFAQTMPSSLDNVVPHSTAASGSGGSIMPAFRHGDGSSSGTVVTTSTAGSGGRNMPTFRPGDPRGMANKNSCSASVSTATTVSTGHSSASTFSGASISAVSYDSTRMPLLPPPDNLAVPGTAVPGTPFNEKGGVAAKSTLYQFYGKKPRRKQLSSEDYFVWNNGGRPHELKFTCIFQCPLTGECFPSGRYGDPNFYEVRNVQNNEGQEVELVWFTKKVFAEHAAAARCYDCHLFRDALQQGIQAPLCMGSEKPYSRSHAPNMPPVPNLIAEKINNNQRRIQEILGVR